MAFCIWDGGGLPTEAEWEYAASGGGDERLFPWGAGTPTKVFVNGKVGGVEGSPLTSVGGYAGHGRWGHADLAGSLWEMVFDSYAVYSTASCNNCANIAGPNRVARGGSYRDEASRLRAAARLSVAPMARTADRGFRCAREFN